MLNIAYLQCTIYFSYNRISRISFFCFLNMDSFIFIRLDRFVNNSDSDTIKEFSVKG